MSPLRCQKHFDMTFPTPWIHLTQTPSVGVHARREAGQAQEEGLWGRQGVINGHQFDSPAPKRKNERKKRPTNQKMQSTADKHALTRSFLNGWAIPGDLDYSYLPRILGLEMNFVRGVCKHLSLGNIFLIHSRLYF